MHPQLAKNLFGIPADCAHCQHKLLGNFRIGMTQRHQLQKNGSEKITYRCSWVTDIEVNQSNVKILVRAGRSRWKLENECFNTLKNQGYSLEHNYGHGKKHLAFNLYLLTLIAFLFHQIFELTDCMYQACRQKFGSKKEMWESLRAYAKIFVFNSWEMLLDFALSPRKYRPQMLPP